MISSSDLKPGMAIQRDREILVVLEQSQNKTARSAMVVKMKARNLGTGSNVELSWGGGDRIILAHIEKKEMQYLCDTDDVLVFMNSEIYEQIEISKDRLKWEINFMKPNDNVNISMSESEILGMILSDKVVLQIVECEPAVRGDTATSASKDTASESGLEIKVPLFINQDETVLINTSDGRCSRRAKDQKAIHAAFTLRTVFKKHDFLRNIRIQEPLFLL